MIVIDASAMVEALVGRDVPDELLDAVAGHLAAPHLLDVEVVSALRGLAMAGKLSDAAAQMAVRHYFDLAIDRYEAAPLAARVWALKNRFTAYDATYLALAEALDVPLHTCDTKLDSGGHVADVHVLRRPD